MKNFYLKETGNVNLISDIEDYLEHAGITVYSEYLSGIIYLRFEDKDVENAKKLLDEAFIDYVIEPKYILEGYDKDADVYTVISAFKYLEDAMKEAVILKASMCLDYDYDFGVEKSDYDWFWIRDVYDIDAIYWTSYMYDKELPQPSVKPSIYFDMDGTLAKWYKDGRGLSYPEQILDPKNHYYLTLEPHNFTIELAKALDKKGYDVCVISSADAGCINDKRNWLERYCPFVKEQNIFFSPIGADKTDYVKNNVSKSILIDDYNLNLKQWSDKGGTALKLINTVNSINKEYGILPANTYEAASDKATKDKIMADSLKIIKDAIGEPEKKRKKKVFCEYLE